MKFQTIFVGGFCMVVNFVSLFGANHYVRSGASGKGTNWNDAYGNLPASLIRGDMYYVADGNYTAYNFATVVSGTQYITIKKATTADHGTDTGWQSNYGGGKAKFGAWTFVTSYWIVDGVTGGGPDNWKTGHGFDVYTAGSSSFGIIHINDNVNNLTIKHAEIHGPNLSGYERSRGISGPTSKSQNLTFAYNFIHETFDVHFYMGNWNNVMIEYNCFERNKNPSDPSSLVHGESFTIQTSDNVVIRYNFWNECYGTAVIAGINGNGGSSDNWEIYGNIVLNSVHFIMILGKHSNHAASNWKVYNNTIANSKSGGREAIYINIGTNNIFFNNIWYNQQEPTSYMNMGIAGGIIRSNSFYDVDFRLPKGFTFDSSNKFNSGNPFVNVAGWDLKLKNPTSAGTDLGELYNMDMFGNIRGSDGVWDRGAIEFGKATGIEMVWDQTWEIRNKIKYDYLNSNIYDLRGRIINALPSKRSGVYFLVNESEIQKILMTR